VAFAYWSRYPNPNSQHVFTEDFVDVRLDADNKLWTKRLIIKTNPLPWYYFFFQIDTTQIHQVQF
jgi:hypothetical protein